MCSLVVIAVPTALAVAAPTLRPPVIRELFTPLACPKNPQSNIAIEGCAERQILATDRRINRQVAGIFRLLPNYTRRVKFVRGERDYLSYRRSQCMKEAAGRRIHGIWRTGAVRAVRGHEQP